MSDHAFGTRLSEVDWQALAEAKRRRWHEFYRSDPAAAVRSVWARGAHVRQVASEEALARDREADLAHHIELKETIGRIGDLLG